MPVLKVVFPFEVQYVTSGTTQTSVPSDQVVPLLTNILKQYCTPFDNPVIALLLAFPIKTT